ALVGAEAVDEETERAARLVLPVVVLYLRAADVEPGDVLRAVERHGVAAEEAAAAEHRVVAADGEDLAREGEHRLAPLVEVPVDPGDLVVLAVGVVVALLRAAHLVAGG